MWRNVMYGIMYGIILMVAAAPSSVDAQPRAAQEASPEMGCTPSKPAKTCREECEEKREKAEDICRKLPVVDRARREACWRKANEDYANCVKDCDD